MPPKKKIKEPTIVKPTMRSFMDSLTIDAGHTMMANYLPEKVEFAEFNRNYYEWAKPTPESVSQFGLFGSDLNYHTYYPDLSLEELQPKEDEFIMPVFRLLSATVVSKGYNPTDFSKGNVLKNSMQLLLGQTVNVDHSTDIGNAIGSVAKVAWQDAYVDKGIKIPAGINGVLKIDGRANPRIARGILMEPPSIHSNSVTVQFRWEKSHPNMEDRDFFYKMGSYDEKGEMIRRIVTEIVRYHETSLVSHGADPYAQKITQDGKLNNPIFANRTYNSYKEYEDDKNKIYCFSDYKDLKSDDTTENNNKGEEPTENEDTLLNNQNQSQMDKDLLALLESLFGEGMLSLAEGQEATPELAIEAVRQLKEANAANQTTITNLTTERDSLSEQVKNLNAQVTSLTAQAEVGKNYLTQLREDAVATYRKLMGEEADETIVNMLSAETTGVQTIQSLMKDYTKRLEEKFPMQCKACGSKDVSRASSVEENEEEDNNQEQLQEKSTKDVMNNLYKNKIKNRK